MDEFKRVPPARALFFVFARCDTLSIYLYNASVSSGFGANSGTEKTAGGMEWG